MATLFDRLGYNFNDPEDRVGEYPDDTKKYLDSIPPILEEWQSNDIANNTVNGYVTNPFSTSMATVNTTISLISTSLPSNGGSTGAITNLFSNIANTCNFLTGYTYNAGTEMAPNYVTVEGEITKFVAHTNRISGVTPMSQVDETNNDKPFYDSAMGLGKTLSYIAYQTSGVSNSAPVLGSFTSLLIGNTVNSYITTISTYANTINASVDGSGVSNLSLATVTTIDTNVAGIKDLIYTRRLHDENYYVNARTVVNEARDLKKYSQRGSADDYLFQNIVGTDKLLTRINA
jgi:hypothetical protein